MNNNYKSLFLIRKIPMYVNFQTAIVLIFLKFETPYNKKLLKVKDY